MQSRRTNGFLILAALLLMPLACSKAEKEQHGQQEDAVALGKQVFENKKCGFCHEDQSMLASGKVPDLTRPIIANDSLFVLAHLKSVERSEMPPIRLTEQEMKLVSRYIAHLHAMKYATVTAAEADAKCPVCSAPVSTQEATEKSLTATYMDTTYYFECEQCIQAFQKAPMAFKGQP